MSSSKQSSTATALCNLLLGVLAAYTFARLQFRGSKTLLMFYLAGVAGIPRRYAVYPDEVARGIQYANASLLFITVLLLGALLYIWEAGRRCVRAFASLSS